MDHALAASFYDVGRWMNREIIIAAVSAAVGAWLRDDFVTTEFNDHVGSFGTLSPTVGKDPLQAC